MSFIRILVVHPYSSIGTASAWKKSCFILLERSDFHMIDNISIAVHAFSVQKLTLLLVYEILLLRYVNCSTNFRGLPLKVEMAPCLRYIKSVLFAFMLRPMPPAAWYKLCSWDLAWVGVFVRTTRSYTNLYCHSFYGILSAFCLF